MGFSPSVHWAFRFRYTRSVRAYPLSTESRHILVPSALCTLLKVPEGLGTSEFRRTFHIKSGEFRQAGFDVTASCP